MVSQSKRLLYALVGSAAVTFCLFFLMQSLISNGKDLKKSDATENFIEFVRLKRPSQMETKKRELPKKPEIKEESLPKEAINIAQSDNKPQRPDMKFDTPKLDIDLAAGAGGMEVSGAGPGAGGTSGSSDEVPLIRIEPQFPQEAAMQGISTGWVRLTLDLSPDGSVSQVNVVESSPRKIFDQAAIKAVLKWRYRPKMVDGKAVVRKGLKIQLDFELTD